MWLGNRGKRRTRGRRRRGEEKGRQVQILPPRRCT
jgi:hypothetical protein